MLLFQKKHSPFTPVSAKPGFAIQAQLSLRGSQAQWGLLDDYAAGWLTSDELVGFRTSCLT